MFLRRSIRAHPAFREGARDFYPLLPGIGAWTTELVALRVLAWPDAFPASDIGVLRALGVATPADASTQAEAWRPWRSYAVMQLWQSLVDKTNAPSPLIAPLPEALA